MEELLKNSKHALLGHSGARLIWCTRMKLYRFIYVCCYTCEVWDCTPQLCNSIYKMNNCYRDVFAHSYKKYQQWTFSKSQRIYIVHFSLGNTKWTQIFESLAHFSKLPSSDWIRTMPKIWGNKLEKGTKYPNIVFKWSNINIWIFTNCSCCADVLWGVFLFFGFFLLLYLAFIVEPKSKYDIT